MFWLVLCFHVAHSTCVYFPFCVVYLLVLCTLSLFLAAKKVTKKSRREKKLQFFPVGATMSDSATALPD